MRYLYGILIVILALVSPCFANTTWGLHTDAGEWAFARGDFAKAEKEFRSALDVAMALPEGDVRLEESLRNLARFYEHRSDANQAEPLYVLLLAAQEHRIGEHSPDLLDTLAALARVAIPTGDHPVALDALERYVAISDAAGDRNENRLRIVLGMLARMYLIEEKDEKALQAQRRATTLAMDNPGLESAEHAAAMESLAQMEFQFGDPLEGERLVLRAADNLAAGEPDIDGSAIVLAGARTAFSAAAFDAADRLARKILDECDDVALSLEAAILLGDIHWMKVRRGSQNIRDLYGIGQGSPELQTAADQLTNLEGLLRSRLPAEHPDVLKTAERLVLVALMQGDLVAAIEHQGRVIDLQKTVAGPTAEATLKAVATRVDLSLASPERGAMAIDANAALIQAQEEAWGSDDSRLLPALKRQYNMLRENKRKKEARPLKKRIRALEKLAGS